jgi:hypothetical protein
MSGDSAQYAYDWLTKRGYAPHQAAGIVGNLVQESGVRPVGATGDNGTAHGIAQWRGPRFQALQQYAVQNGADPNQIDTQLGFLDHELNTSERGAGDMLRNSQDVRGATRAMMAFERPQGFTAANPEAGHGWQNRLSAALQISGMPGADPGTSTPPGAPQVASAFGQLPAAPGSPLAIDPTPGIIAQAFADQDQDVMRRKQEADATASRRRALFGDVGGMFAKL